MGEDMLAAKERGLRHPRLRLRQAEGEAGSCLVSCRGVERKVVIVGDWGLRCSRHWGLRGQQAGRQSRQGQATAIFQGRPDRRGQVVVIFQGRQSASGKRQAGVDRRPFDSLPYYQPQP